MDAIMTYRQKDDILSADGKLKKWVIRYFKKVEYLGLVDGRPVIKISREVWDSVRYDIPVTHPRPVHIKYPK